jgi:hypothetical protein
LKKSDSFFAGQIWEPAGINQLRGGVTISRQKMVEWIAGDIEEI